jgi:hypothetical protein
MKPYTIAKINGEYADINFNDEYFSNVPLTVINATVEMLNKAYASGVSDAPKIKCEEPKLWEVLYQSKYYDGDNDCCEIDIYQYVISNSSKEAIEKAMPEIEKALKKYHKIDKTDDKIKTTLTTSENFVITKENPTHARFGGYYTQKYREVKISNLDKDKYELKVVVVPIKE